jgi:hypothetical protein
MRAPATSAMAVAWGTPRPEDAAGGAGVARSDADQHPTAPVRMRCRPAW